VVCRTKGIPVPAKETGGELLAEIDTIREGFPISGDSLPTGASWMTADLFVNRRPLPPIGLPSSFCRCTRVPLLADKLLRRADGLAVWLFVPHGAAI
jgi:hypothetical protein